MFAVPKPVAATLVLAGALALGPAAVAPALPEAPKADAHILVFGNSHDSYTSLTYRNVYRGGHSWWSTAIATGARHDHLCHR